MGMYDCLPKGSQVKLWECQMVTKKVGDTVFDFGLPEYVVLLREGGYIVVKDGVIAKIVENHGRKFYTPMNFPRTPCFDKWGTPINREQDLEGTGILGEDYYWKR